MPPQPSTNSAIPLPRPLIVVISLLVVFHLGMIVANGLATSSGPWPIPPEGMSPFPPPQFAQGLLSIFGGLGEGYLRVVRMTNSYNFSTNRPGASEAIIEAQLKIKDTGELKTVKLPDPNANFWVRHRQSLLAAGLRDDMPVPPPQGEAVAAPGGQVRMIPIWSGEGGMLKIVPTPEHLIPRGPQVMRPGDWARLLARSYGRYLCRSQSAISTDIVRRWRNPIPPPPLLMGQDIPPLEEFAADFGEIKE
jgi:hypothetical protein